MKVQIRIGPGPRLFALPPEMVEGFETDIRIYGRIFTSQAPDEDVQRSAASFKDSYSEYEIKPDDLFTRS